MKKVQVCVKNGYEMTKYYDVIIDNKQSATDAITIVRKNSRVLGISPLAYIGFGLNGVQMVDQYAKCKPGTIFNGDYYFNDVLVKGGE